MAEYYFPVYIEELSIPRLADTIPYYLVASCFVYALDISHPRSTSLFTMLSLRLDFRYSNSSGRRSARTRLALVQAYFYTFLRIALYKTTVCMLQVV